MKSIISLTIVAGAFLLASRPSFAQTQPCTDGLIQFRAESAIAAFKERPCDFELTRQTIQDLEACTDGATKAQREQIWRYLYDLSNMRDGLACKK